MTTPNPMLAELDAVVRLGNEAYVEGKAYAYQDATVRALNFMLDYHATLADMAKRLEAAERDAARYRWLRDKAHEEHRITTIGIYIKWGASYELGSIGGADADDEIDDAMAVDATQEGAG